MFLERVVINNFRNIKQATFCFSSDLNLISGDNAAGKSSILEALGYLISGRSFRTSKRGLLINHDSDSFVLFAELSSQDRIGIGFDRKLKRKAIKINQQTTKNLSLLASILPVQTISPESYHLVDSGPLERRKYLDWLLFHVEQSYQSHWSRFNRLLKQRNSLLRRIKLGTSRSELDLWNQEFVEQSLKITQFRQDLLIKLLPKLNALLKKVDFNPNQSLSLDYIPGHKLDLMQQLVGSSERDISLGSTQYGPHRSDLLIKVGLDLAKDVLSRGQKKLLINCLYLAQTELLKDISGKDSVFIIDDFTSELDQFNQSILIKTLKEQKNVQIFVSCLHPDMINFLIKEYNNAKMFHVKHGVVREK
ncbi:MAG: DNA replication/repair protein RecF [Enterobacterales bacterium]|nr:DNA replication/repair protein RecF [Enterobacterales bacterium]